MLFRSNAELVCLTFDLPPAELGWPSDLVPWPPHLRPAAAPQPTAIQLPASKPLLATRSDTDAPLHDDDVIHVPVRTPEGIVMYVISRRALLASVVGTIPALVSPLLSAIPVPLSSLSDGVPINTGDPSQRLDYVLRHPARIDTATMSHMETVLIALETIERHVEASALIGAAIGHLGSLTTLLSNPLPPSTRRHLCSIAGETAGLAARLYAQLSDAARAESYFRSGLTAAHEAGDQALVAYLIGVMAGQPRYRHDPMARLTLLRSCSPHDATPPTRVFLAAKEADVHALVGDTDSCLAALERAAAALVDVMDDDPAPRPRAPWWPHETWLAGEQGSTLARLGRYQQAEKLLTTALTHTPNAKHRLWLMTALARVRSGSQQPEEAARIAIDILAAAKPLQMTTVVNEIMYLRQALDRWSDMPVVRDLDEALREQHRLPA